MNEWLDANIEGIGTMLFVFIGLGVFFAVAGIIERTPEWLRRLHALEHARLDWRARLIRDQAFWKGDENER